MELTIRAAVINAGGKGTRLSNLLPDRPKALVEVFDKPIIIDQIDKLILQGITEFYFILGFQSKLIKVAIDTHLSNRPNVQTTFFIEDEPLGSGGGLLLYKDMLPDYFIFLYCDIFFDINITNVINNFTLNNHDLLLVTHPNDHPGDSDLIVTNNKNYVLKLKPHPHTETDFPGNLVNAAFYIIKKACLPKWNGRAVDFAQDIIPKILENNYAVFGYKTVEYLKDMGTPERLSKVRQTYSGRIDSSKLVPIVFLDRDGTINKITLGDYLTSPSDLELTYKAATAIRQIREKGYLCMCITNQPVIARGELTHSGLKSIHNKMEYLLGQEGAYLDEIIYCPHHPHRGFEGEVPSLKVDCDCRKPKIGMFSALSKYANPDPSISWMVGDTEVDVQAGNAFGLNTALLGGRPKDAWPVGKRPSQVFQNLAEFADALPNLAVQE